MIRKILIQNTGIYKGRAKTKNIYLYFDDDFLTFTKCLSLEIKSLGPSFNFQKQYLISQQPSQIKSVHYVLVNEK